MKRIRLMVDLDYDDERMHSTDAHAIDWFHKDILFGEGLLLHSNEIGDTVGEITVVASIHPPQEK